MSTLIGYLSNQPLHDPCTRSATSITCGTPVTSLSPTGVLVTWEQSGSPGQRLAQMPGSATTIGDRAARLDIPSTPSDQCKALKGTREIDASILMTGMPSHDELWRMTACLADPAASQDTVIAVARSLRFARAETQTAP
jgi:hypothetical protein